MSAGMYVKTAGGLVPAATVPGAQGAAGIQGVQGPLGPGLPNVFLTKTSSYTMADREYVSANASAGPFTVTLPLNPAVGAMVSVQKIDSTPNVVTVVPGPGGSIGGDASATMTSNGAGAMFVHHGSDVWRVLSVMAPQLSPPVSAFYADGSDGNVTISTTVALTRDMFYDSLTVTGTLQPNGWKIFVKNVLTVSSTGRINGDGDGGGGFSNTGSVGRGMNGPGGSSGVGLAGNGSTTDACVGGAGGAGGAGAAGAGGAGGVPGGMGTNNPVNTDRLNMTLKTWISLTGAQAFSVAYPNQPGGRMLQGGASGGSGGGDGTFGSRPGAAGGNVIVIAARTVLNDGIISANGGTGVILPQGNTGGAGGGGGGVVIINCSGYAGLGTVQAAGGAGGPKSGTGVVGSPGVAGRVVINQWQ